MGVPTEDEHDEPDEVVLPTMAFVNVQAEAIQSEIEAIAGALDGALGTTQAKALKASLANVRKAMASGETTALKTAAKTVAARTEAM